MIRIVVPEFLPAKQLSILRQNAEVIYDPDMYSQRPRLLDAAAEAHAILIRNRTQVDVELLESAKSLRVVGRLGVGLDNIDTRAASSSNVSVIPAAGGNAVSVAEYVIGAMLVLQRRVFGMTASMVAGEWPRQGHAFGYELMGKVLGLIGFGAIAREVASRAEAFGMKIVAHDPYVANDDEAWAIAAPIELDELLAGSDVVSIHVPRNEDTEGMIGEAALALMKTSAVLINTSRGGIVDEIALAGALRKGALAGAALDVFATEPLGIGPGSTFRDLPNIILTPHVAGNTEESVDRVAQMIVDRVLAALGIEQSYS